MSTFSTTSMADQAANWCTIPTRPEEPAFSSRETARNPAFSRPESLNQSVAPSVYSGPTIGDVEAALAMGANGAQSGGHVRPRPWDRITLPERFSKTKDKFSLRVKCCSNEMADDGYKWRKYGQKFIKNSQQPRSYYRCTDPRCSAKKQVQRSTEEPETLVVTYEGLHLHYAFTHLPLQRDSCALPDLKMAGLQRPAASSKAPAAAAAAAGERSSSPELGALLEDVDVAPPQGLLEDVVPGLVRNPCGKGAAAVTRLSSPPTSLQAASSSSPSSSMHFPWSQVTGFDDLEMLSLPSSPSSFSSSDPFPPHYLSWSDLDELPGTV